MMKKIRAWLLPWGHWRNKRFWLLVAVLAWTFFGFFGTPPLVERALTRTIEQSGRSIEVDDIQINPYALSARMLGVDIADADGTTVLRFDEFYANFQLASLFRWAWTFREIRLAGLHLEEERFAPGDTRLGRLAGDLGGNDTESEAEPESGPPRLVIQKFSLEAGSLGLTDRLAGGFNSKFGPISISVQDLRTLPDHAGDQQVSIVTPHGGVIAWRGDLQLVPLASEGHFTVSGKGLPAGLRYADHFLPIAIEGEEVEVSFDYSLIVEEGELHISADNWNTRTGEISARMDGSDQSFVRLGGIELQGGSLRWPEKTVHAESLTVDGVGLEAWLDENGRLSLLDALPRDDSVESDGRPVVQEAGWQLSLDRIGVSGETISLEDRRIPGPAKLRIQDLALVLDAVDNQEGTVVPVRLNFGLASGGSIDYVGSATVLPQASIDGRVSVEDFALPLLQPWLAQFARVELDTGTAGLQAEIAGSPPETLLIAGNATVNDLEVRDAAREQRLAGLTSLQVQQFEVDLGGKTIRTAPLALSGAYGRIHIFEDLSTNIGGLMLESEALPAEADAPGFAITIGGIELEEAALDFADDSLPLPFRIAIRDMDGRLSTLSTMTSEPADVSLGGHVGDYGEAQIQGKLNPWDFTESANIGMTFRNLQMAALTPYTVQYAGYAIDGGKLDMELGYRLQARQLEGDNNIVITELVLGEKIESPDAASLPLKLAVALLTDSEGVIDVDLPVSGDLDDPTFKISGIVWKAIGNLIARVVTSPFRFLGGLVGVDSEDFGTLRFQPGSAELSPPDREQLAKLAEAMRERPELGLLVTGLHSPELDRPALQKLAFEAEFEEARNALIESGEAELIDADRAGIESLFRSKFPDTGLEAIQAEHQRGPPAEGEVAVLDEPAYVNALRQRLIDSVDISAAELEELAAGRAQAVVDTLQAVAGDTQLSVSVSDETVEVDGQDGAVELALEVAAREAPESAD